MAASDKQKPTSREVAEFHIKSDVDGNANAHHHTLGSRSTQASPGNHTHDEGSSPKIDASNFTSIFLGVTITGSRGGNAAVASVIAALTAKGATDATTP